MGTGLVDPLPSALPASVAALHPDAVEHHQVGWNHVDGSIYNHVQDGWQAGVHRSLQGGPYLVGRRDALAVAAHGLGHFVIADIAEIHSAVAGMVDQFLTPLIIPQA